MHIHIEVEREEDGRWIAEVPDIPGVIVYGDDRASAVARAQALAVRVLAERRKEGGEAYLRNRADWDSRAEVDFEGWPEYSDGDEVDDRSEEADSEVTARLDEIYGREASRLHAVLRRAQRQYIDSES